MLWSDGYKTEAELREAIKKGRLTKDGVVADGGRLRVPALTMDSARPSAQFVAATEGMTLRDVASAVSRQTMLAHMTDGEMRREAVRQRLGDAAANGMSDVEVETSFVTLVSTSLGDIARFKASQEACNAWRHAWR